jgi:hypothetical protein
MLGFRRVGWKGTTIPFTSLRIILPVRAGFACGFLVKSVPSHQFTPHFWHRT